MDLAATVSTVVISAAGLALVAYLFWRLMRWARGRTTGASMLGAVLTAVTQGTAVQEAKRGRKGGERRAGDPPSDE